nr:DUF3006 domain-containing protein [Paenibacillus sp. Cedars]
MRKGIIDRFEGSFAVVEIEGSSEDIPKELLPNDCSVGDVLTISDNKITVDKTETLKRKEEI